MGQSNYYPGTPPKRTQIMCCVAGDGVHFYIDRLHSRKHGTWYQAVITKGAPLGEQCITEETFEEVWGQLQTMNQRIEEE